MEQEKINIAELLKDAPCGIELYSTTLGTVAFNRVSKLGKIQLYDSGGKLWEYNKYGIFDRPDTKDAECTLFPSKNVRTWQDFQPSWKHKIFKAFDRILRKSFEGKNSYRWYVDIYNYWNEEEKVHCALSGHWSKDEDTLPFEGNEELAGKEVK